MKKAIVVLAIVLLPASVNAGLFCEQAASYGYRAGWANIACVMELINEMLLGGDAYDRGDADDLGG